MKELSRFAFAGGVGYLVDTAVLLALHPLAGPYGARVASFLAAVATTWLINRSLTFRHRPAGTSLHREFGLYLLTALGGGAINLASYSALVYLFDLRRALLPLAVAVGSLAGMMVNFALSKHFVFRHRPERAQAVRPIDKS